MEFQSYNSRNFLLLKKEQEFEFQATATVKHRALADQLSAVQSLLEIQPVNIKTSSAHICMYYKIYFKQAKAYTNDNNYQTFLVSSVLLCFSVSRLCSLLLLPVSLPQSNASFCTQFTVIAFWSLHMSGIDLSKTNPSGLKEPDNVASHTSTVRSNF